MGEGISSSNNEQNLKQRIKLYILVDPGTNLGRYIGITKKRLSDRLSGHIWEARYAKKSTYKCHWLKEILINGQKPSIFELESFNTVSEARAAEVEWIRLHRLMGTPLVNTTDGGEGTFDSSGGIGRKIVATRRANDSYKRKPISNERLRQTLSERPPETEEQKLERRHRLCKIITLEMEDIIVKDYYSGISALQISKNLKIGGGAVATTLDRLGVKVRSRSETSIISQNNNPALTAQKKEQGKRTANLPELDRMKKYGNKTRLDISIQNNIVQIFKNNPQISLREIARQVGTSHTPVAKVLKVHGLIEKPIRNKTGRPKVKQVE